MVTREKRILGIVLFAISLMLLLAAPVCANSIQLTLSPVFGSPGNTVTVNGTISNGGPGTIYLNGEDFTLSSPSFLNGDTTNFFLNAPLFLAGGTNSGLIGLFTFDIAPGTPAGLYPGSFLDIFGGPNPSDQNLLATAQFSVTVTPEPESLELLATGILAGMPLLRRRSGYRANRRSPLCN